MEQLKAENKRLRTQHSALAAEQDRLKAKRSGMDETIDELKAQKRALEEEKARLELENHAEQLKKKILASSLNTQNKVQEAKKKDSTTSAVTTEARTVRAELKRKNDAEDPHGRCSSCDARGPMLVQCWVCSRWDCRSCSFWCTHCPRGPWKYTICGHCNADGNHLVRRGNIWWCARCL